MQKGKQLLTGLSVICAVVLFFQVAFSAFITSDPGIEESFIQSVNIAKNLSSAELAPAGIFTAAASPAVSKACAATVQKIPDTRKLAEDASFLIATEKDSGSVLEMNNPPFGLTQSDFPASIKSYLASYLVNGICIDAYLQDAGDGLKELIFEYGNLNGERKVLKPGLFYDEVNMIFFGKDKKGMLGSGFDFDYGQKMFFYAEDLFQQYLGFCELYDILSPMILDDLVTARIKFNYEGLDWMVQAWKGRYVLTTMGGEIGIYSKPESRTIEFYDCGVEHKMPMSMSVWKGDEHLFTKKTENCWWQTGFVFRGYCAPADLTVKSTLVFPTAEMKNAFTSAIDTQQAGIVYYTVDGNAVNIVW